ncbi:SDR family oxidoreductase [Williamsia maris]|uniref:NAD(P)-dependent dehydrogenase, short-chain alcohol dehydrogenase family n=1 Tax=Williamsia maris TaxID=72806 RepID=A0ABT1HE74_9NOCA|nr:SDR family oxidoreductase [Williamsia maris]MCP2176562.1 NAD(P)-dependent dehydrogenase, short-chain alcohol dehydrogenase family [Williamsia maris]
MAQTLDGQTVLVVGGAKNLGLAIATRASELGAQVVIGARDDDAAVTAAAAVHNARPITIDITDEASIAAAAAELGAVDHIVATAAAHHNVAVTALDHDRVVTAFEAKVIGPLMLAKHFAPTMPPSGSIILFSGVAAWKPSPGKSIMGITNGAVAFAVDHLAAELAPLRVNAISPGIVDSGTWDGLPDADRAALFDGVAGSIPAGRVGTTADIVDAATWLLTAGFISGETIHVEGGARSA